MDRPRITDCFMSTSRTRTQRHAKAMRVQMTPAWKRILPVKATLNIRSWALNGTRFRRFFKEIGWSAARRF